MLKSLDHLKELNLEATGGGYRCDARWGTPDLQINMEDAKTLFGDSPLKSKEAVLILVIPD